MSRSPLAIIALAAAMLLISSSSVLAQETSGPGVDWVLPDEHRLFLNGVVGQATIDREWPMVTGIPEGDVEFDKTSSVLPSSLFDISSSPLLGPVGINGNVTVELFASLSTKSDACKLSNIIPGSPLGATTTFYVTLTMGSYVILDQEPTETLVMDESFAAPHLFSASAQNVNTSLGPGDTIGLEVSVVHECAQTGHIYWGTFDAHSGIIIEGDVLSPTLQHTVDPNRIVRIELDPSSPWGESDYSAQTVDVVGPYDDWSDMVHSFYDEDSRVSHFEDPHGTAVGESNSSLRTWSLSDPLEPGRYMIDVCIQLSDRPYSENCEAYAVLKFRVDEDSEPLMSPVVVAILVPFAMAGGILASLRYSMLPTPVYGVLLVMAIAAAGPAYSLGPIDHDPIRVDAHPPSFTLLSHSGGSMSLDEALDGNDALVIGIFVPGSPNAPTQYNDFTLASNLAESEIAFIQIATSPDLLAIDVDAYAEFINQSWPILLDTSTQSAGKSLPSGPTDAVVILDSNGFVVDWSPRTMSSTQILETVSDSERAALDGIFRLISMAFTISFLPLVIVALPRNREARDPLEGEFPGTGAIIALLSSAIGFGLWFGPITILVGVLGQSAWLPVAVIYGIIVISTGIRVFLNGEVNILQNIGRRLHSLFSESLKAWTSEDETSDDLHLGLWIGIIVMIADPTLVVQGVLSGSNTSILGPVFSMFLFIVFSLMGGIIALVVRTVVSLSGNIGRILGPMSIRIRAKTWGTGLILIGIWWTLRDSLLVFSTVL